MRAKVRLAKRYEIVKVLPHAFRRKGWFFENADGRKVRNVLVAGYQFVAKHEVMRAWPVVLKVDISPVCNLRCTVCVHASSDEHSLSSLRAQRFRSSQRMSLAQFSKIADEVAGKTMAVSLYYLGDPLVHPDLDAICAVAAAAGLNSHISTNFSFYLSPERIRSIVTSGLTHMTVCVDGLSQELYSRTRVGGDINLVLSNLARLMECRKRLRRVHPRVEVQFIKFQHNVHELRDARRLVKELGVDQFSHFWGALENYSDWREEEYVIEGSSPDKALPQCLWPHFAMLVKYDGDVIPCCEHRVMAQYDGSGVDKRIVGNVFASGVWNVWNSPSYRALRRLASSPTRTVGIEPVDENFCDACPKLFKTDLPSRRWDGSMHRWEEHYRRDGSGKVVRRRPVDESPWQPVEILTGARPPRVT